MRFVRVFFILVIVSVVASAASVTYITQVLDPNDLKPTLVNAAQKQQVKLELQGNIMWAFWPWFGISVEEVRASSPNWDFAAERLEGSLSVLSLLSDTVVIDRLNAIAPKVTVRVAQKDKRSTVLSAAESSKEKNTLDPSTSYHRRRNRWSVSRTHFVSCSAIGRFANTSNG